MLEERKHTSTSFSASNKKVALIPYVLAGYVRYEASAFLWERKPKRPKPVRGPVADEQVQEIGRAVAERGCACSRKAHAFHEQWQLKDWVARENASKGIAPRSERILLRLRDLRLGSGSVQPSYLRGETLRRSSAAKMYMVRLRHRMGMKLGALTVREPIEMTEIRHKARCNSAGNIS